jgi:predicted RNase H-like HicB family nuclease
MSATLEQLTGYTTLVKPELPGMTLAPRRVVLHQDADNDGAWSVVCPALPGCLSQGLSVEEALAGIKESMELWLETALEFGDFIPAAEGR